MINLKKFATTFLSVLLCVAMVGCSNKPKENKDAEVRAEFQKAFEAYKEMTYDSWTYDFEVSDSSILSEEKREKYGDNFKSISEKGITIFEHKRDESNKITDCIVSKQAYTRTVTDKDGKVKVEKVYVPGDGYKYEDKDGTKTKTKYVSSFRSFAYDSLNIDNIENITLATEGNKKIFKFNYRTNPVIDLYCGWGSYLRIDSNIEIKNFSGTLTVDEKNNTMKETMNAEYVDKKTGVTAKGTMVGNYSKINQELTFPKDLDAYKLAE